MESTSPATNSLPLGTRIKRASIRLLILLLALLVLAPAAWVYGALNFTYSSGERVGFAQKLAHKGWACKTFEGELAQVNLPGQVAETFAFTVRNKQVAEQIDGHAGHKVALQYEQHKGLPTSCFGDTEYFVVGVRRVD